MNRLIYLALTIVFLIGTAIFINACKKPEVKEDPVSPPTPSPGLNEYTFFSNVVVLDSTITPTIEDNKYTFSYTSDPPDIKAGDLVIGYSQGGFIKRVQSVEKVEKSRNIQLILTLWPADFEEVFYECDFDIDIPIKLTEESLDEVVLFNDSVFEISYFKYQIEEGSLSTDLIMNLRLVRVKGETKLFSLSTKGSFDFDLTSYFETGRPFGFTGLISRMLVPMIEFPFLIGPVPAQFNLYFRLYFGLNVHQKGSLTYSYNFHNDVELGAEYDNSNWKKTWMENSICQNNYIDWNLDFSSYIYNHFHPEIKMSICNVSGPEINLDHRIKLETTINYPNWKWKLDDFVLNHLEYKLDPFGLYESYDSSAKLDVHFFRENSIGMDSARGNIVQETLTDPRDGQEYKIVTIGEQTWFAESLNIGVQIEGEELPSDNDIIEKWCYDNDSINCDIYGGLYNWEEAMNYETQQGSKGICPDGWHIPSRDEWNILIDYFGGDQEAGGRLKEAGTSHWDPPNEGATNTNGFAALPNGYRFPFEPIYKRKGIEYDGWTSTSWYSNELGYTVADHSLILSSKAIFFNSSGLTALGMPVRCIKD